MTSLGKLEYAWIPETAHKGEGMTGEPANQCCVTALLVNDIEGGFIWKCKVGRISHFYNTTEDGKLSDYTVGQFPDMHQVVAGYCDAHVVSRNDLLKHRDVKKRYELLKERYYAA